MRVKQIRMELKKKLFGRYRRSSRVSRSRSRSVSPQRKRERDERHRGDYQDHKDRGDCHGSGHINTDRSTDRCSFSFSGILMLSKCKIIQFIFGFNNIAALLRLYPCNDYKEPACKVASQVSHEEETPPCAEGSKKIRMHKELLSYFFKNAKGLLDKDGEVHITQRENYPYDHWKVTKLAKKEGFHLFEKVEFQKSNYPGYHNKRVGDIMSNQTFPLGNSFTLEFTLHVGDDEPCQSSSDEDDLCKILSVLFFNY
ncbi:hypothetical protein GIB67_031995 [Kingdonia uniflora]|uniref:25S rRNA (uridine-N(3))-methyltransferase BMT5-like domain-containing protein n=1 Tax=Kingdonia uniflora TaxID=39325 RepID=A0A7J7MWL0_9MAGN|nr:hypothetical protein GIB67_031995 [Kingdonia uniflora]